MKHKPLARSITTLLFTILLLPTFTRAQSITDLDIKRGFKDFKLGDLYQKWASNAQLVKSDGLDKHYLYNGNCCNLMFEFPVEKINLVFRNDKLIFILVELERWDKPTSTDKYPDLKKSLDKYDLLNNNFKLLFNNPSHINTDVKAGTSMFTWQTSKTILSTNFKYLGNSNGCSVDVVIADMSYFLDKIKQGF